MKHTISVTEAARNFADIVSRVFYREERFILERGGRPVARLIPVPRGGRLGDLPGILDGIPSLSVEEAEALGRDMDEARASLPELRDEDPWES
jgi:antitoxin (DNA-binding transcriptional repressor) of toxin-antitoxin stability system